MHTCIKGNPYQNKYLLGYSAIHKLYKSFNQHFFDLNQNILGKEKHNFLKIFIESKRFRKNINKIYNINLHFFM